MSWCIIREVTNSWPFGSEVMWETIAASTFSYHKTEQAAKKAAIRHLSEGIKKMTEEKIKLLTNQRR